MFFICELNEDMISVKVQNGDGKITSGANFSEADIAYQKNGLENFTEAPWLYRRQDENGVSFESVSQPEKYLGIKDGTLVLCEKKDAETFYLR